MCAKNLSKTRDLVDGERELLHRNPVTCTVNEHRRRVSKILLVLGSIWSVEANGVKPCQERSYFKIDKILKDSEGRL